MNSNQTFFLSLAAMVCGVVLLVFGKGEAMATTLILAATGGLAAAKFQEAKRADKNEAKAVDLESTQTVLRDQVRKLGDEPRA